MVTTEPRVCCSSMIVVVDMLNLYDPWVFYMVHLLATK